MDAVLLSAERSVAGRFGPYGGRYVPETLVAALDDLDRALRRGAGRSCVLGGARRAAGRVRGPAVADLRGPAPLRGGRRAGAPQARGPEPHRRPQDQQHGRPGAARAGAWASAASSPRPARGSTASRPPRCAPASGSSAWCTWARRTWPARRSTCTACDCSARRWSRSSPGTRTLKDATNEALRDWVTNVPTTHYIIGSVVGPDPYPRMVRDFQAVIGREARAQMLERIGRLPRTVVACVGGGSNAMGIFTAFLDDAEVELVGVEAAGDGLEQRPPQRDAQRGHARRAARQPELPAPGRRRPGGAGALGVAPVWTIRAWGRSTAGCATPAGCATTRPPTRRRSTPFRRCAGWRGSFPRWRRRTPSPGCGGPAGAGPADQPVLVCLSGRGDKDVAHVAGAAREPPVTAGTARPTLLPAAQVAELINGAGEGAPRLPDVPPQQSDLPARHAERAGGVRPDLGGARRAGPHRGGDRLRLGGAGRLPPAQQEREPGLGAVQGRHAARSPSGAAPRRRS